MSEDPSIAATVHDKAYRPRASELLEHFLKHDHDERITLADLVRLFSARAFGALILLLALPNVLPVPGLSTVTGLPIMLIAGQLALGWAQPRLPRRLGALSMEREAFLRVLRRAQPYVERIERRLLRPRLPTLTMPVAERLVGGVMVVLAGVLALPIIFGNQAPAFALALLALGLIEKDGAFVIAGLISGVIAVAIVLAVLFGFAQGLLMLIGLATV